MARLIDAEWLLRLVCGRKCGCNPDGCGCEDYHECEIGAYIKESPTVDAVPVVRGEWIREDETQALLSVMWHCSKCEIPLEMNGIYTPIGAGYKYCPNCGAHMERSGSGE